jgi:hypothetical protein
MLMASYEDKDENAGPFPAKPNTVSIRRIDSEWGGPEGGGEGSDGLLGNFQLKALLYVLEAARDSMSLRCSGSQTRLADCTCELLLVAEG